MDNENMKRWRDQEFAKTEHNADPQCDYPKDCARVTVELIDEVLALRAQVTEAKASLDVSAENFARLHEQLAEARRVARDFHRFCYSRAYREAEEVVMSWPAPEES